MRLAVILLLSGMPLCGFAQEEGQGSVSIEKLLDEIESQFKVRIFYKKAWVIDKAAHKPDENLSLNSQLDLVLEKTDLRYEFYDHYNIVLFPGIAANPATDLSVKPEIYHTLSGKILSATEEEPLTGANITVDREEVSTISDENGQFFLELPEGQHQIIVGLLGFHTNRFGVDLQSTLEKNVFLFDEVTELEEIVIGSEALDNNISSVSMGATKLDIASIKKIPALMGEVDIVKGILALPGVQTVGEAASGFNVRGGSIDQNLVLLDGAPLFNPAHIFGFFSIINPDAVKDITLYKGSVPSKFGGRLSSVLDIQLKEGNSTTHNLNGGIGLFASRLGADGPLKKGRTTYSVSGRTSYSDWALGLFNDRDLKNSSASFYDTSVKITHLIGSKDRIVASGYLSSDEFKLASDTLYDWQSRVATLSWNHAFDERLTASLESTISDYQYGVMGLARGNEFDWEAGINHKALNLNINYARGIRDNLNFGLQSQWYDFSPGSISPLENSSIISVSLEDDFSRSIAAHIDHEKSLSQKLALSYGIRYTIYQNLGPGTVFDFTENRSAIADSTRFTSGEVIKSFHGLEPRLSARYTLDNSDAIKISYNRMRQNVHLISNSTASTPVDIWQTSNSNIKPQFADIYSLGYFKNYDDNAIETSAEIYYKSIKDLVDFKDGATILLNRAIETDLLQGDGRSYGLELLVKKKRGLLTGWGRLYLLKKQTKNKRSRS